MPDHETLDGYADVYLTDEVDTWGKRTILFPGGKCFERWYLFAHEYEET